MMKCQIGLGVLSIPATFDALGLIPGVICLVAVGLITTWSAWIVGVFKLRHRHVYAIDDAGGISGALKVRIPPGMRKVVDTPDPVPSPT